MQAFPSDGTFWIATFALIISLLVCLGGLYALLKQKVIVNEDSEVISIELPAFGRVKTNLPSIAAIFLGIALGSVVVFKWQFQERAPENMPIVAKIHISDDKLPPSNVIVRSVTLGVVPMKYQIFDNEVLPNAPKELTLQVSESDLYYAYAFTPTKQDKDGQIEYIVSHGTVNIDDDPKLGKRGTFSANLRIR